MMILKYADVYFPPTWRGYHVLFWLARRIGWRETFHVVWVSIQLDFPKTKTGQLFLAASKT